MYRCSTFTGSVPSTSPIRCVRSDRQDGLWAAGRCDAGAGHRIAACALRAGGSITAGSPTAGTSSANISTTTFHNDGLTNNEQSTGTQRVHAQALCYCATPQETVSCVPYVLEL